MRTWATRWAKVMAGGANDRRAWIRLSGKGVEFFAVVVGFTALGYWFDRRFGSSPKGVLVGAVLGIVAGGYSFLRASLAAIHKADPQRKSDPKDED